MTEPSTEAVRAEIAALLESVSPASTRIEAGPSGWLIWAHFANGVQHGGHTGISAATPSDPVEWTRDVLLPIIRADARLASRETVEPVSQPDDSASLELGAELLADEGDAGQSAGDDLTLSAGAPHSDGDALSGLDGTTGRDSVSNDASGGVTVEPPEAYPGLLILPDEIGARRNAVLAAITARQLVLLDVAADETLRNDLAKAFSDYTNTCALGLTPTEIQERGYRRYQALEARDKQIGQAARQCVRAALEADLDGLERIAQGLEDALR